MNKQIVDLVENFFRSFKFEVSRDERELSIKNIPEKMQILFKLDKNVVFNVEDLNENSGLVAKIKDYLKNKSSKTLLKIDFDLPKDLMERIHLRNCSLNKIEKKHENNYFSRFTFLTTFRFLNISEQIMNEIFVHGGKVVGGNLNDYKISEGKVEEASTEHLSENYNVSKEKLKELLNKRIAQISEILDKKLVDETNRIEEHYKNVVGELSKNRNRLLERIKEAEKDDDKAKVAKLNEELTKGAVEKELKKIDNEKKIIIENEKMKYSLDIENKLIDTTIIYYPIFKIDVQLNEAGFNKSVELTYNPLTEELSEIICDSCKTKLESVNVCHGGHICCSSCLHSCGECGKRFCRICFLGLCESCGKLICNNCGKKCLDCGKLTCKNCMRKSALNGTEKCRDCIVFCPICLKLVEKKYMTTGSDGRLVCKGCIRKK